MAITLAQIRQQHPEYDDMSDEQLADALHNKYYSDMPKDAFYKNLGIEQKPKSLGDFLAQQMRESAKQTLGDVGKTAGGAVSGVGGDMGEAIGYGAIPAEEQIPTGISEGLQSALAGITGQDFKPSDVPDEYGAGAGRMIGGLLGQGAATAPFIAAGGAGAGAMGMSKLLGSILGGGVGAFATTPGDTVDRGIAAGEALALPAAVKGGSMAYKALKGKVAPMLKKVSGAHKYDELEGLYNNKQQELEAISDRHSLLGEQFDAEKKAAAEKYGIQSQEALSNKIKNDSERVAALDEQIAQTPKERTDNMLPPANNQENLARAHIDYEDTLGNLNQSTDTMENALNPRNQDGTRLAHKKRLGEKLKAYVDNVRKDIGSEYNALRGDMSKINIELKPQREKLINEMGQLMLEGEENSPEAIKLMEKIKQIKNNPANAHDYFEAYRHARDVGQSRLSKGYDPDALRGDQIKNQEQGKAILTQAKKMYNNMKEQLPDEVLNRLEKTQSRYKDEIAPLYKNRYYSKVHHGKTTPINGMDMLESDDAGNPILRDIIKKDPEMTKLALGEKYGDKPHKLIDANETVKGFIDAHPEISEHHSNLERAHNAHELAKDNLKTVKDETKSLEAEQTRVKAGFDEITKQQQKRAAAVEERKKLLDSIPEMRQAVYRLQTRAADKNLTLKEKIKVEKELKQAKQRLDQAGKDKKWLDKQINRLALGALAYTVGKQGVNAYKNKD